VAPAAAVVVQASKVLNWPGCLVLLMQRNRLPVLVFIGILSTVTVVGCATHRTPQEQTDAWSLCSEDVRIPSGENREGFISRDVRAATQVPRLGHYALWGSKDEIARDIEHVKVLMDNSIGFYVTGCPIRPGTLTGGMSLEWGRNSLWIMDLGPGWSGSLPSGVRIGSTFDEVLEAYPERELLYPYKQYTTYQVRQPLEFVYARGEGCCAAPDHDFSIPYETVFKISLLNKGNRKPHKVRFISIQMRQLGDDIVQMVEAFLEEHGVDGGIYKLDLDNNIHRVGAWDGAVLVVDEGPPSSSKKESTPGR
jgi:hypothetical protein